MPDGKKRSARSPGGGTTRCRLLLRTPPLKMVMASPRLQTRCPSSGLMYTNSECPGGQTCKPPMPRFESKVTLPKSVCAD
jgi:hypothetical protein